MRNASIGRAALAVVGLTVVGGAAQAQNPVGTAASAIGLGVKKPIRLSIGGYFPTDSSLRNGVSKNFVRYGLSYDIWKNPVLIPVVVGAYVDGVFPKDKDTGSSENSFRFIGVGIQAKKFINAPLLPASFFYGLGVGPYFTRAETAGRSENRSVFGGKVFIGAELAGTVFGTLDYTYLGKVSTDGGDYKPSGFGASIGVRF
ncbi:MAG: hypothetical protein SFU56_09360 [Capsulimonadales bacterium]|nr:hypothetical protein [Capsulimonadales bacterium]